MIKYVVCMHRILQELINCILKWAHDMEEQLILSCFYVSSGKTFNKPDLGKR